MQRDKRQTRAICSCLFCYNYNKYFNKYFKNVSYEFFRCNRYFRQSSSRDITKVFPNSVCSGTSLMLKNIVLSVLKGFFGSIFRRSTLFFVTFFCKRNLIIGRLVGIL